MLLIHSFHLDEEWDNDPAAGTPGKDDGDKIPEYGNKPPGPEPTRFGDWQYKGRSTDF